MAPRNFTVADLPAHILAMNRDKLTRKEVMPHLSAQQPKRHDNAPPPATALSEAGAKRSKYGNVRVNGPDGRSAKFRSDQGFELVPASKAEWRDYELLDTMMRGGAIVRWVPQVSFLLPGGLRYRCDALVWWKDGRVTVRDCKGQETKAFIDRKRLMLSTYGITVELA